MRASYRCIAVFKRAVQRAAPFQYLHKLPSKQCLPVMKGKGGAHPSGRTLRASRHNENSEASGAHIKTEEETEQDALGPLTTSKKQHIKREPQAETPLKPRKRQKVKKEDPVAVQMVKLAPVAPTAYTGPFPKLMRPSPEECRVTLMLPVYHIADCQHLPVCQFADCLHLPAHASHATLLAGHIALLHNVLLGCSVVTVGMQAARDGLARLHGEPQHAKQVKPDPDAGADSLHTHSQQQVLDSLVRFHTSSWRDMRLHCVVMWPRALCAPVPVLFALPPGLFQEGVDANTLRHQRIRFVLWPLACQCGHSHSLSCT